MKILGIEVSRAKSEIADRIEPPVEASEVSGTKEPKPWLYDIGFGGSVAAQKGLPVATSRRSEQHGTVFSCCNNIAGDLMKVPLRVHQRGKDGKVHKVLDHPASYLLNVESSPGVPARVMRFAMVYAFGLRGSYFAYGPRDGGGELEMIDLIDQDQCQPFRVGRDRLYDFEDGAGIQRRVLSRSMIHLRYLALDGWTGRSPIQVASETMGLALSGQEAAARNASGVTAKAVIKMRDDYEDDAQRLRNARRVKEQIVSPTADGMPILGPDEDIKSLDISAADKELLESRKFDREQIAAMYRMPPSKLQMLEFGVKANGEQQAIDYQTDCLFHWSSFVEAQAAQSILTDDERRAGLYLRHDFSALLQPTFSAMVDAVTKGVNGPIWTPDEGRARIGQEPLPNGEGAKMNPAPNMTRKEEPQVKKKKKGDDE